MPKAARKMLQNGYSYDEPDRMPRNITISNFDLFMYVVAIVGHLVDLGVDINVAVRYSLARRMMEFGWTLAFILVPAFVNTAVSIRMYAQDKQQESLTNEFTKRKWLRVFILVLQLAPVLRFADSLIYAIKSRAAEKKKDISSQRMYYGLMLKEDSDAALLRIFECFLEAAPQQVLQTSLLLQQYDHLAEYAVRLCLYGVHAPEYNKVSLYLICSLTLQTPNGFETRYVNLMVCNILSICSSIAGMGWCLAGYQRAVRFAQQDKNNMSWPGTVLQILWHFLVTLSRVASLSTIAYLFPYWTVLACVIHILIMTTWLQFFDKSLFCSHNKIGQISFSFTLGAVYLFTYILPVEGRTRYRYTVYYSICFIQNITCSILWYIYADEVIRLSIYYFPFLILSIVPYVLGIVFMMVYYAFLHPKARIGGDVAIAFKADEQVAHIS